VSAAGWTVGKHRQLDAVDRGYLLRSAGADRPGERMRVNREKRGRSQQS